MVAYLRYKFKGYNRVSNGMRRLASDYREEIDSSMGKWTKGERASLKGHGYPPQRNAPQPFKTDRQRRFFFWALANGIIVVPYPRTGKLANSWSAKKQGAGEWALENSQSYSRLVVKEGEQAGYHRGHWWTADAVIRGDVSDLTKAIESDLTELAE